MRYTAMMVAGALLASGPAVSEAGSLAGTEALEGDVSQEALADRAIDDWYAYFHAKTDRVREARAARWRWDRSSAEAYAEAIGPQRDRLARILGVVEQRLPIEQLSYIATTASPAVVEENQAFTIERVRWAVHDGFEAEGLLLEPRQVRAQVVLLGDADDAPEALAGLTADAGTEVQRLAVARRLAAAGCRVVVPVLIDRADDASGSDSLDRWTNQPHREWIYRQAFQVGRHIIGYEIQQALSVVDWFEAEGAGPIGVVGYGEGGLLALHAAALDERIDATLVSGHFGPREGVWQEPIYRNVWQLLRDFGDAELAAMVAPRTLIVEHSEAPEVDGPPEVRQGRRGAAPGGIGTFAFGDVQAEFDRARQLAGDELEQTLRLVHGDNGGTVGPWSETALAAVLAGLGIAGEVPAGPERAVEAVEVDADRQHRLVRQLERYTQRLVRRSEDERGRTFWQPLQEEADDQNAEAVQAEWHGWTQPHRDRLWDELIGRLPAPEGPFAARTQLLAEGEGWTGHVVELDVYEDVMSWGYLLVPDDIAEGEQRPVVVCQHGLGGTPGSLMDPDSRAYAAYAVDLVERGFVVYSPYNINAFRGGERFRQLQRVANPLGVSIFSAITAQHDAIVQWLGEQPFVDADRIGFYGLSYGGKTAMRVGALLEGYDVVICSADFNEWNRKVTTVDAWFNAPAPSDYFSGYPFTVEYEIPEFDLAHTFNYAEMAAMIAPRPFMVERGHHDRVGTDEWVAFEYAKVRRLYNSVLKLPERARIEYFDGGHIIRGEGTYKFLHEHLRHSKD